jgi:hypothetical protein
VQGPFEVSARLGISPLISQQLTHSQVRQMVTDIKRQRLLVSCFTFCLPTKPNQYVAQLAVEERYIRP